MNCLFFSGLEYIEEVRNERGVIVSYNCQLCECSFTDPNAKRVHLKGRRHRLQYKVRRSSSCAALMLPWHLSITVDFFCCVETAMLLGIELIVGCGPGIFDLTISVTWLSNDSFKNILSEPFEFSSSRVLFEWCWRDGLYRKKSTRRWRWKRSQILELRRFARDAWRSSRQRNPTGDSRISYLEWGRSASGSWFSRIFSCLFHTRQLVFYRFK